MVFESSILHSRPVPGVRRGLWFQPGSSKLQRALQGLQRRPGREGVQLVDVGKVRGGLVPPLRHVPHLHRDRLSQAGNSIDSGRFSQANFLFLKNAVFAKKYAK